MRGEKEGLNLAYLTTAQMIINIQNREYMSEQYRNRQNRGGWSSLNNKASSLDLRAIFANPTLTAIDFLNIENIIQECKAKSDVITQQLMKNTALLEDLLNICLYPFSAQNQQLGVTNKHTHRAVEILTTIDTEEISQYFLRAKPSPQPAEEDNVITEESMQNMTQVKSLPIVKQLFTMLDEKGPLEETRLWYMQKIGLPVFYQKPRQMIELFKDNKQICLLLFRHSYSNSILEWLTKILQMEDSNSFFESQKIIIFRYFVESLSIQEVNQDLDLDRLTNYEALMTYFLQKVEDRFDKSKYIKLCKAIFTKQYPIDFILVRLSHVLAKMEAQEQTHMENNLMICLMTVVEKYMHFSLKYKPAVINNMHNSFRLNQANRSENSGLDASVIMDIVLDGQCFSRIKQLLQRISRVFIQRSKAKNCPSASTIISFLKLYRTLVLLLEPTEHQDLNRFFTPNFIRYSLEISLKYRNSTALHNTMKDILIEGILKNYKSVASVLLDRQQSSFLSLLGQIKGRIQSGNSQYDNQIYHIFQVILKKGEDHENQKLLESMKTNISDFADLQEKIKQKQKVYSTLIGGNPRKQSSSCVDQQDDDEQVENEKMQPLCLDSQPIHVDKKVSDQQILSPSVNDIIEGRVQHWYDCGGLPLDSDQSKDDLENQTAKSEEAISVNQAAKKQERNDGKSESESQLSSQLSKRFKNIGVVECQQRQIRVHVSSDRYKDEKARKHKTEEKSEKNRYVESQVNPSRQLKDKQQQELENEIKILEDRRHHFTEAHNRRTDDSVDPSSPQVKARLKKKVDSFDEGECQDGQKIESRNINIEMNEVEALLNVSSNKDKTKSLGSFSDQQIPTPANQDEKRRDNIESVLGESMQGLSLESQVQHFATYLSYQISQIISQLD